MGCYLSKPRENVPVVDSVSHTTPEVHGKGASDSICKSDDSETNLIAAHTDGKQPRTFRANSDSAQDSAGHIRDPNADRSSPSFPSKAPTMIAPDTMLEKEAAMDTKAFTEFEGLPISIHQAAPLPADEEARLAKLKKMSVLDTDAEQRFDDITQLVCSIFNVPIAIVSLVDRERQWFKSCQGLACNQTDRKSSFCAWTLVPKNPEVLVVPDATEDVRFQNNPLVLNDPCIRFYAGAPLVTQGGERLGSLCIIDKKARKFDAESCRLLSNFAEVVVREIEKDEERRNLEQISGLQRSLEDRSEGMLLVDLATPDWNILFQNEAWLRITGMSRGEVLGAKLWQLFLPAGQTREQVLQEYKAAIAKRLPFTLHLLRGRPTSINTRRLVIAHFKAAATDNINTKAPVIGIPGQVGWQDGQGGLLYFVTVQKDEDPDSRASVSPQGVVRDQLEAFEGVQLGPLLGQGGFGKVYRGLWNGAAVAVKIIQHTGPLPASEDGGEQKPLLWREPERVSDDGTLLRSSRQSRNSRNKPQRMERNNVEGVLTLQLSHPNVVQTFKAATKPLQSYSIEEADQDEQLFETWLLLEFCDKGSLQNAVDRGWFHTDQHGHVDARSKPNMKAIKATAQEIAGALAYLHRQDLLHGDLTGGNILLASSDVDERGFCAKVADFGLSRTLGSEPVDTGTYGTVTHMPPELLTTVLLWEMYTGQRPWQGLNQMQIIFHLTQRKKKLLFTPGTPPQLQALGMQCMSTEPEGRPNFDEVLRLLDALDVDA